MEEPSQIKEILYEEIKKIPAKELEELFVNENYSKLIENLFEKILPRISNVGGEISEKLGVLSESISHYILTEMMIPSQRKIVYKNIEVDIVIPDLNMLKDRSDDAIIIYFAKSLNNNTIQKKIDELQIIQKNIKNIWVIAHDKMNLSCKTYQLSNNENSLSDLFTDLKNFVNSKKLDKLKIFKT
jgi:hypothetical protein|tara:strand:- start:191 stop:745 length:555 start_codon:yes stop_codon:yes gene_type:complete